MDEFSHGEAFDTCTKVLINSSIAVACGPFFDRDIMHAMEICVEDVRITMNEMASKNSIALLEAQVRNIWFFLLSIPQNERKIHWFCSVSIFFEGSVFTFQFLYDKIHNYVLFDIHT